MKNFKTIVLILLALFAVLSVLYNINTKSRYESKMDALQSAHDSLNSRLNDSIIALNVVISDVEGNILVLDSEIEEKAHEIKLIKIYYANKIKNIDTFSIDDSRKWIYTHYSTK